MPIVLVDMIGDSPPREGLAKELADACSPAFPPEHREVWVQVRVLPSRGWAVSGQPTGANPIFVHVLREVNPQGEALKKEIQGVTTAVARVTGRPMAEVHVIYEPSARGRMAFGGRLLE
jgi:phenylpyruvate tautomerase PptA (4-oxalocrotonate tautomerase family)